MTPRTSDELVISPSLSFVIASSRFFSSRSFICRGVQHTAQASIQQVGDQGKKKDLVEEAVAPHHKCKGEYFVYFLLLSGLIVCRAKLVPRVLKLLADPAHVLIE